MKVVAADRVATAAGPEGFPREALPEVAFLGRSNVGKSSLLNRLAGRRKLAHTSRTPGRTRLLHFYRVRRKGGAASQELLFVDLPGYGFAQVPRAERRRWRALVEGYLGARKPLRVAVLVQDLRRDVSDDERDLLAWLAERGTPVVVAATKADRVKPMRRAERARALAAALGVPAQRVVGTSATTGLGIGELWRVIDGLVG